MREARELQTQIEQLERHIAHLDKQLQDVVLAKPEMPTKIIGPNLEEILNAAGFYRGDAVCCNDYEKCIKPCTPKGRWLAKQEIVKSESHIVKWSIPVDPNNFGEPLAQFEQEPVAWMVRDQVDGCRYPSALKNPAGSINGESQPLYTAPSRKEWVGLTDHDIELTFLISGFTAKNFAHAIEAKLKELNT
jgi:hypothetical protein